MYADPLQSFKIPGLEALVTPLAKHWGYDLLPAHASEILFAALFYQLIFLLSGVVASRVLPAYCTLTPKTKVNFDIHVVSHIQAILILALCAPLFADPILAADHFNAHTPYSGFVSAMAIGYFLWDSLVCIRFFAMFGPGFLIHGLAALFVFGQSMRPMLHYYCPHFLFFELSTPFLNVNWFASHLPEGYISFTLQKINGIFLLSSFFGARIVWGFYQAYCVARDFVLLDPAARTFPLWAAAGVFISNISLDLLNVYWFYKMVCLAVRALKSGTGRSTKKSQ